MLEDISYKNIFHLCTGENFPIFLTHSGEYAATMAIVGLCSKSFPDVKVYTFAIMSNHFHFLLSGERGTLTEFFNLLKKILHRYLSTSEKSADLSTMQEKLFLVKDIDYLRNVIVYINRNGYVVNRNETPFSYAWGANRCFYNADSKRLYELAKQPMTVREVRDITHSRFFDNIKGIYTVDGIVSPFCFCCVEEAEHMFSSAHQYFQRLTRQVESYKEIADEIGESLTFTDNEIFTITRKIAIEQFSGGEPYLLPAKSKAELAKILHYDYNASNKQIARVLRLDLINVNALFPVSKML